MEKSNAIDTRISPLDLPLFDGFPCLSTRVSPIPTTSFPNSKTNLSGVCVPPRDRQAGSTSIANAQEIPEAGGEQMKADFAVENHGTIFLLRPLTPAASEWIDNNLPEDCTEFAGAVVVEHRYITEIVAALECDGLNVN